MSLYARGGVPECWIVDLAREALEVHRGPQPSPDAPCGWRYRSVSTLSPPATVAPLIAPAISIALADLLP
jgi:Uma2 family endonuclease